MTMALKKRLVGAAIMIVPWPVFLLAAKGLGFVSSWLLIATLLVSAFGLTLLISPANTQPAPQPASPTSTDTPPDR
jgi:hypothetical protein